MKGARRTASDLFLKRMRLMHDPESVRFYSDFVESSEECWTVNCRNPRIPPRTALPLNFATYDDAERAMLALIEAGLCTHTALHRRIKIERRWDSVREIMVEALNW